MIYIIQSKINLISDYLNHNREASSIWLQSAPGTKAPGFPSSWFGYRSMIGQLREQVQKEAFEEITDKHRVGAALLLRNLYPELDQDEKDELKSLLGSVKSNLSHNFFIQEPFYIELKTYLEDLLKTYDGNIYIPNIFQIDSLTLSLLLKVFKNNANFTNDLYIGIDEDQNKQLSVVSDPEGDYFDELGLVWKYTEVGMRNMIHSFLSYGAQYVDISHHKVGTAPETKNVRNIDLLDDDIEYRAYEKVSNGKLNEDVAEICFQAIERSFETYDFANALELGIFFLNKSVSFNQNQLTQIYTILALSAHNRQFSSTMGNKDTNSFIEKNSLAALENESDPLKIALLYYRLAVLKARREKKFDEGLNWANKCINISKQEVPFPFNKYSMAWAFNIRAYIFLRKGDFDAGKEDILNAFKTAQELMSENPDSRDFCFTNSVFADNSAGIYEILGDLPNTKKWLYNSSMINGYHTTIQLYSAKAWCELHKRLLRADLVIKDSKLGLDAAREKGRADYTDLYLNFLRDFYYRTGKITEALRYMKQAVQYHTLLNDPYRATEVSFIGGKIALKGGLLDLSGELFDKVDERLFNKEQNAVFLAYRGILSAQNNDIKQAEDRFNKAIQLAVDDGERDTMAYVSCLVGIGCKTLSMEKDAAEAFMQAVSLIEMDDKDSNLTIPSLVMKIVLEHINFFGLTSENKNLFEKACKLAPIALVKNSETWWYLRSILTHIPGNAGMKPFNIVEEEWFNSILLASSQREDCSKMISSLENVFGYDITGKISELREQTETSLYKALDSEELATRQEESLFVSL
ncbi:MAG: hypothetical protein WBB45_05085 [Cyclobacteriaceae bacterium]